MEDLVTLIDYFDEKRKYCLLGLERLFGNESPMRLCYIRIIEKMNIGEVEFEKFATEFYGKRIDTLPKNDKYQLAVCLTDSINFHFLLEKEGIFLKGYVYLNSVKRYRYKRLYGFLIEKDTLEPIIDNGDFFKFFRIRCSDSERYKLIKELDPDNTIRDALYDEFPSDIISIISAFLEWKEKKKKKIWEDECSYIS
jgi:hypothetical protein